MTEKESLREQYAEINRRNPFVRHNHIEVEEIERDRALLRLTIRPESLNVHGRVHGGAIYTMADNAAGCATSTDGRSYVTQASDMHFLRNQSEGTVRAEAIVRHRGRTIVLVDVTVTGEEEKLLASGTFTFFCIDQKPRPDKGMDELKNNA
ncbi:MAG: PaaI family thioesterase [Oscillospiraceae bacterium]|nr:PaaI family thioesterase [Oscillospiraceae bacterium]